MRERVLRGFMTLILASGCDGFSTDAGTGADRHSTPTLLARASKPAGIAVDDGFVYFTDVGSASVFRAPKAPPGTQGDASLGPPFLLAKEQGSPTSIAVDAANVYWVASPRIRYVAKGGGDNVIALVEEDSSYTVYGMVTDGSSVFYGTELLLAKCSVTGHCQRGGNAAATVVPDGGAFIGIAAPPADTFVYTASKSGVIAKIDRTTGATVSLATGQTNPYAIRADSQAVYWTNRNGAGSAVLTTPVSAPAPTPTVLSSGGDPTALGIDGTNVYWIDAASGSILRCAKRGCNGTPTTIAANQPGPHDLALDDGYVYWTNMDDGTVMRVAK